MDGLYEEIGCENVVYTGLILFLQVGKLNANGVGKEAGVEIFQQGGVEQELLHGFALGVVNQIEVVVDVYAGGAQIFLFGDQARDGGAGGDAGAAAGRVPGPGR